jgi:hypothetical protein
MRFPFTTTDSGYRHRFFQLGVALVFILQHWHSSFRSESMKTCSNITQKAIHDKGPHTVSFSTFVLLVVGSNVVLCNVRSVWLRITCRTSTSDETGY